MTKTLFATALLCGVLLVGCTPTVTDYFPMALGDFWSRNETETVVQSGPIDTTWIRGGPSYDSVVGTATIQGQSGWADLTRVPYNSVVDTVYFVVAPTRVLRYRSLTDTVPVIVLEQPFVLNATWVVSNRPHAGNRTAKVMNQEKITVPAGTFDNCWRVEQHDDSNSTFWSNDWYADGVGLVKSQTGNISAAQGETTNVTVRDDLNSYGVK